MTDTPSRLSEALSLADPLSLAKPSLSLSLAFPCLDGDGYEDLHEWYEDEDGEGYDAEDVGARAEKLFPLAPCDVMTREDLHEDRRRRVDLRPQELRARPVDLRAAEERGGGGGVMGVSRFESVEWVVGRLRGRSRGYDRSKAEARPVHGRGRCGGGNGGGGGGGGGDN